MRSAGRIEVAGMRRRAVSLAIDAAVASALGLAAALLLQRLTTGHPRFLAVIVGVVAAPLYFIPQWAVGRSVGMWLLHLELVRQDNGGRPGLARSVVRLAMWVVDLAVENVIFLMTAPGDLQKRAPHDLVSRTVVIRSRGGKGRFWELSWADWLTHHHDERPFMDRMSDRSGRHIRFVVGSRRRVAVAITVGIFIYGGGAVVALLGLRARPAREFQVVADLVSLLMITGAIVLARFRLSRPGAAKPPKPRRYVVGGWASAGLSTALAAGAAVAAIHRSWVILAVALYIAALSALLAYGCVRAARIFADPSRRLPKDVIDKITTFPRVSPVAQAYRVTLVLRDGRRVRRVMVAYGGLVFSIGRWRTRLDFRPADAVDALNEVRDGAPATASSRV